MFLVLLFGIVEYGLFYWNTILVQSIAAKAAYRIATTPVSSSESCNMQNYSICPVNSRNQAIRAVGDVLDENLKKLGVTTSTQQDVDGDGVVEPSESVLGGFRYTNAGEIGWGSPPYTLYEMTSTDTVTVQTDPLEVVPLFSFMLDYRNPEEAFRFRLTYCYKPIMFGGIQIPMFATTTTNTKSGVPKKIIESIEIIPKTININSSEFKQAVSF
jgi:Flp pilus assembly protein TadG